MASPLAPSLQHLMYFSSARPGLGSLDIRAILGGAQVRNRRLDVTGLLLFTGRHFVQVLEGRAADLDGLVKAIQLDTRHDGLQVLVRQSIRQRRYGQWAMAFVESLDDADALDRLFINTNPDPTPLAGILERAARRV